MRLRGVGVKLEEAMTSEAIAMEGKGVKPMQVSERDEAALGAGQARAEGVPEGTTSPSVACCLCGALVAANLAVDGMCADCLDSTVPPVQPPPPQPPGLDEWVQCDACHKWRKVQYTLLCWQCRAPNCSSLLTTNYSLLTTNYSLRTTSSFLLLTYKRP